jgi:hypothetical protein
MKFVMLHIKLMLDSLYEHLKLKTPWNSPFEKQQIWGKTNNASLVIKKKSYL